MLTAVLRSDRLMEREFWRWEKSLTAVSAKNAARNPQWIPLSTRLAKILLATPKTRTPSIKNTAGPIRTRICDNLTVDKTTGINVSALSTNRRQSPWSNTGFNRMTSRRDTKSSRSGRKCSLADISLADTWRSSMLRILSGSWQNIAIFATNRQAHLFSPVGVARLGLMSYGDIVP